MKSVLMLTPDYPPNVYGGIGTHVFNLAKSLEKKGWNVTIVVIRCDIFVSSNYIVEHDNNIEIIRFLLDQQKQSQYSKTELDYYTYRSVVNNVNSCTVLLKYLKGKKFSILHAHDHYVGIVFDVLKNVLSIPTVSTIHSCKATEKYYEDSIRRYVAVTSDHIIAISKSIEEEITHKYHVFPQKITVINNGITDTAELVGPKNMNITFSGRLIPSKGCDILIRAFAQLKYKEYFKKISLIIMGDGSEYESLKNLTDKLCLKNVIFKGWVSEEEVKVQISKAAIHVVPSRYEPFGMSAIEAMAVGTCVCASDVGGMKDYIASGYDGVLIEANNVEALAGELNLLLEDKSLRDILSQNALRTSKKYCYENIIDELIGVYDTLLDNNLS